MLYDFTPITYDCKIYMNHMNQKSVDVDMAAVLIFHCWKDTPIRDFHREFLRLKDT